MSGTQHKILIAAGGTGGHIYPALAIADALHKLQPQMHIAFVGTAHGLENKIIPKKGYPLHHIPVGRLNSNVSIFERLKTVILLPFAFLKSVFLLKGVKPDLVLGVGGHASGPLLLMASFMGIPTAIWEPNAMPGMANRILSRFVDECWVVFDEARKHLKSKNIKHAGMPVRTEIESVFQKNAPQTHDKFHILAFGGSQGARGINTALVELIEKLNGVPADTKIVHQTGPADFERIKAGYGVRLQDGGVELKEYLDDMADRYQWADIVICRSGTGTLSELAACGKAAILIPFPFASDDHQKKNAESLVDQGAAEMIVQKDLTVEALNQAVQRLKQDPALRQSMAQKIRAFHQPFAAENLAKGFIERIERNASR
jgi:UDP-N-acetylglucosamine--N-acetylmuramyl-(pentapeptide) pyrophosphoryl-undecaprenol N-acetylglucosamine transferase